MRANCARSPGMSASVGFTALARSSSVVVGLSTLVGVDEIARARPEGDEAGQGNRGASALDRFSCLSTM